MPLDALNMQRGPSEIASGLPTLVFTGTGLNPKPRIRVDNSQTAFWEGRQFRAYHEFNLAAGASAWLRLVTPVDVIVLKRILTVVQGNARLAISQGGTPTGTWNAKTSWPVNNISSTPAYAQQSALTLNSLSTANVVTGHTERDVLVIETGTSQAASVQDVMDEAGQLAGTYYAEIRNTGASALRGVYHVLWEEHQPQSSIIY